jgi:hypothetical protein
MEMVTKNQRNPEYGAATPRHLKEAGRPTTGVQLRKDLIMCRRHSISPQLKEDKGLRVWFERYPAGSNWRGSDAP